MDFLFGNVNLQVQELSKKVEELTGTLRSQEESLKKQGDQVKELTAMVRSQEECLRVKGILVEQLAAMARAQQRFMGTMMLEKLTGEVGEPEILEGFADVLAPSVGLTNGIVIDDDAANAEAVELFKKVHKLAKDRESGNLRKKAAQMLGSLMLKSDSEPEEIEFMYDDLVSVFSSATYPRLLNEVNFFEKMEAAFTLLNSGKECPLSNIKVKRKLVSLLDFQELSFSSARRVELWAEAPTDGWKWNPSFLSELKTREFVHPKREYKSGQRVFVVTEVDLRCDATRISYRFAKEPDTVLIFDVSGSLDNCGKLLASRLEHLPSTVRHLSFANGSRCTEISDDFLKHHPSLVTVDFTSLKNVTKIGDNFLFGCLSLTAVDIAFLNVVEIGDSCFSGSSSLTTVDLASLNSVLEIGNDFLSECLLLTSVDLTGFNDVTTIGDNFLRGCSSLTAVDIVSPGDIDDDLSKSSEFTVFVGTDWDSRSEPPTDIFSSVTKIGNGFFFGCSSLTELNLDLINVTKIGDDFLRECSSLTELDLYSLRNFTGIGDGLLAGCSSLRRLDLPLRSELSSLSEMGFGSLDPEVGNQVEIHCCVWYS
eukprot:TRINITY_DN6950_c0_g1_i1.p1 TRINITY_DN6950_c0_g1~~TRINITY_DN6950_c0_g1_i1.p1  ORF type:complete len:612 (+),score=93.29 TRINITY_DN6950_c0_g1_i1:56-1837(+)